MALVDFDGAFLAVNPALCDLVGRSERELLRATWQSITHPDDVERVEREVGRSVAGEDRTFRSPTRYLRPDGQVVWVLLSASLIRSRMGEPLNLLTQVVDITEQRNAEEGRAWLASIVESSDDAIVSQDFEGGILSWNRGAERMYGYTAGEVIGRNISTIVPPDRRDEIAGVLAQVRLGRSVENFETVRVRKDNWPIDVSLTLSPIIDGRGVAVRASSIARDITLQKRMAAELDRSLVALEAALAEARTSEARSRAFLCDAAHHLRNPVAGIRACAETLLRGPDSESVDRLVAEIARETAHVSRLVDRLLRIARLEQGEPLTLKTCDLLDLCDDQAKRAQSLAPHLSIVRTGPEAVMLDVDHDAVREIVANLLENACRHAVRRIDVSVARDAAGALVRVRDDGPGVPDGSKTDVFAPFTSLDGNAGSGLGLALSKALARAHGGDLTCEDGSFVLRIPDLLT